MTDPAASLDPHLALGTAAAGDAVRRRRDWLLIASLAVVAVLALIAIFGRAVAPYDPESVDLGASLQGPTAAHLLGTDQLGRDLLSRVLAGAATSLFWPMVITFAAALLATALAVTAAWIGGLVDPGVGAFFDVVLGFPAILLAIVAAAIFGNGLFACALALSIAYTPYLGRIVRSVAIRERTLPYIDAASAQGFSGPRIAVRHLLPNIAPIILAQTTILFGYAMIDIAALSFLGLGVQPPDADWGALTAQGKDLLLRGKPGQALYASLMIVITVVAVNILGQRLMERQTGARR
jgi:peptide/nickel transport system permease protein